MYCIVLFCTVLYCAVLCCTTLYSTVQYSIVQYSTIKYSTVQYPNIVLKFLITSSWDIDELTMGSIGVTRGKWNESSSVLVLDGSSLRPYSSKYFKQLSTDDNWSGEWDCVHVYTVSKYFNIYTLSVTHSITFFHDIFQWLNFYHTSLFMW